MQASISSTALLLLLCFLGSVSAVPRRTATGGPQPASVAPAWRADLRAAIGGKPLGYKYWAPGEVEGGSPTSLWFVNESTLAATFVIRVKRVTGVLSRPDDPNTEPFRLRALYLDADAGKIAGGQQWPAETRNSLIVAVRDGDLIVQAGRRISVYRPSSGRAVGQTELPATGIDDWYAHASPTGESIVFIASNLATELPVPWVRLKTEPLRIVRSWSEVQSGWVGISDEAVAMTECVWFETCKPEVEMRKFPGGWTTIVTASKEDEPHPRFAGEDALILAGKMIRVVRATDGRVLFSGERSVGEGWWGTPIVSAGGAHFVCLGWRQEGAHPALDMYGHSVLRRLLVYDLSPPGHARILEIKGTKIEDVLDPRDVALSPDGRRLAILSKEMVYMFDLPPLADEGGAAASPKR